MRPYYDDGIVTLYHADCRDVLSQVQADALITDPPYPNNAGHFFEAIEAAREVLSMVLAKEAIVFWSELDRPPVPLPLVAVHVWHRANVNGRPWEPAYHYAEDGSKRRSEVLRHAAVFDGAGPGCAEYLGHPTQKPIALMGALIRKTSGTILDPFCGVGSTLRAAKDNGRRAIGVEINERYCETAARRLAQESLFVTRPSHRGGGSDGE